MKVHFPVLKINHQILTINNSIITADSTAPATRPPNLGARVPQRLRTQPLKSGYVGSTLKPHSLYGSSAVRQESQKLANAPKTPSITYDQPVLLNKY